MVGKKLKPVKIIGGLLRNMNNQVNNDDIADAQWHLDQLINGGLDDQHLNGIQNFINIIGGVGQQNHNVNNNIVNHTNNLVNQLLNMIGGHQIRRRLIVELEYEIGIRGNAMQVPVPWVINIVQRLVAARIGMNNGDADFINNFLNHAQGYNVNELAYVLERLQNMQMPLAG